MNQQNKAPVVNKSSESIESIDKAFFLLKGVKKQLSDTKDSLLKTRLNTLIKEHGMKNESEFFHKLGISRQYWYRISWGIDECPTYLKIKIAQALGVDSSLIFKNNSTTSSSENITSQGLSNNVNLEGLE